MVGNPTNLKSACAGAFTPVCSSQHLPGYIKKHDEIKSKGVDTIAILAPNDPFVMKAWAEQYPDGEGKILYLADGTMDYTKKLGFEVDLSDHGLGVRLRRFSLLAEDGVVKELNLEESGGLTKSGADEMCTMLPMAGQ